MTPGWMCGECGVLLLDGPPRFRCPQCRARVGTKGGLTTTARAPGHGLLNEGRVLGVFGPVKMLAPGRCSCGAESPKPYDTVAGRKRWHRCHKAQIIDQRQGE